MPVKKSTFKQRIRKNDMKQRHKVSAGMRQRMGAGRRSSNRYDRVDNASRPIDQIVSEIAEGIAVPAQEAILDPRRLTDLLLRPADVVHGDSSSGTDKGSSGGLHPKGNGHSNASLSGSAVASSPAGRKVLPTMPLAAGDPLALPDTAALEEEERQFRLAQEAAMPLENKNLYRHRGQAYLFWERVGLHPALLRGLRELRFTHPTPVQEEVLPQVLLSSNMPTSASTAAEDASQQLESKNGSDKKKKKATGKRSDGPCDVIVSAETGSGKTLVFALPILQSLLETLSDGAATTPAPASSEAATPPQPGKKRSAAAVDCTDTTASQPPTSAADRKKRLMQALIISPTRELALQIDAAMRELTKFAPGVVVGCVVGGMAAERQQRVLNRHPHILICTPGRLWDLVQKNEGCYLGHSISRRLSFVVLDEADKMLQSGKFEELKALLERIHCPVLPAGFVQEREEGAEAGEMSVEAGRWDPEKEVFVPFSADDDTSSRKKTSKLEQRITTAVIAGALGKSPKKQPAETPAKKKAKTSGAAVDEDVIEEVVVSSKKVSALNRKKKLEASRKKHRTDRGGRRADEEEEEEDALLEEEEEMEDYDDFASTHDGRASNGRRKDEPQPIPMPPEPAAQHRVVTYVTSATLSLQTNYERKDFSSQKSIIRTSNADVLNKVLQQLEIKPSNAKVFALSQTATVAARINETYLRCPDNSKDLYLYYFLKTYGDDRSIIFVNAISMLRRLVKLIEVLGIPVVGLHASMQQRQRLKFIDKFKSGAIRVLVATDVASRGLDIDGLKYVLHYQVPRSTDAYIHRCGRTARCGGTGLSVLLVNAAEHMSFRKLMESLGRKESEIETFALQPTIVHQLQPHLRIALQIDKLQKEIGKSRAQNQWVSRMSKQADLETDDMYDDAADAESREKMKAIKILQRELQLLIRKFTGSHGGKGSFRSSAYAIGAQQAEQRLQERANRQTLQLTGNKESWKASSKNAVRQR